jgi:Ran GTPase-activating protein (RanGAP) involved in mRNA processing and transport
LFIDWNPIYAEPFHAGPVNDGDNKLWKATDDTAISPFAQIVRDAKKLQVLFLRHSGLTDNDLQQICKLLSTDGGALQNKCLKVIDLSHNDFTGAVVSSAMKHVFETNRALEYVGLAKNDLVAADVIPILKAFGRQPFPAENVAAY